MKKKALAMVLAGTLSAGLLAACGDASAPASGSSEAATAAATEAAAETATAAGTASAEASTGDFYEPTDADGIEDWVTEAGLTGDGQAPDWSAYDSLISDIYTDTDLADRDAKMHQAETMLMATGAIVPLYYYNDLYLENTAWSGNYANVFGTKFFQTSLKDGKPADVMKINLASEPDHLDPQLNSTVDGAALASAAFVGLYTYDADGNVVPALADGDPTISDDGTEYTVKMKSGLKWSDGSDLNAEDIVNSWKRAVDPATGSDYAYLFSVFDGYGDGTNPDINVQATDDTTITFKLTAPCPYMMGLLAFPVFMPVPEEAFGSDSWANEADFVSDGPYTLQSWTHNESMTYVKNPNYYDVDNVTVDELDFMLSADDTAILAAYQAGDIDYADTVPTGEIQNLKDGDDFHVIPNLGTYYVGFNVNSSMFEGKTVAQAAAMRRALGLLIDRQYIVDTIGQTEQKVATSFIPYSMSNGNGGEFKTTDDYAYPIDDGYYQDYSVAPDQNTAEAIKLLEYAGYEFDDNNMLSADTPITINYLTNEGTGHEGVAQAIQQDLSTIGVQMNISVEDWQTFINDRKQGNYDVARQGWLADYDDPINMLEMYQSSSGNNDQQLGK